MAKPDSEFEKLLCDAPMAPDADTVTVVGTLTRTPDAARFNLTLADGRTVTLDVDAVKSAKAIAGAIGQSLVQVALDAKRVPESLVGSYLKARQDYTHWSDYGFGPWGGPVGGGPINPKHLIENTAVASPEPVPFMAASPHHAHPAVMAMLSQLGGTRTYLTAYEWTADHHTVVKPRADPQ